MSLSRWCALCLEFRDKRTRVAPWEDHGPYGVVCCNECWHIGWSIAWFVFAIATPPLYKGRELRRLHNPWARTPLPTAIAPCGCAFEGAMFTQRCPDHPRLSSP